MSRLKTLAMTAASIAAMSIAACSQAQSEPVSTTDKEAIEKIVHEYIVNNPEVLIEAFEELDRRQVAESVEKHKEYSAKFLALENAPTLGPADAPITIVEFFDYNCPHCRNATSWLMSQLDDKRQDVRVVFMELPVLDSRTRTSALAARASVAASMQGKYREMHTAMMQNNKLNKSNILKIAAEAGLDVDQLEKDMESAQAYRFVDEVLKLAREANVQATPSFYVNGHFVEGLNKPLLDQLIKDARSS